MATIGADEVKKALQGLSAKLQKKILRPALREGAKVIAAEARRLAPVETGQLKRSIKVKAATKLRRRSAVGVRVVAGEGEFIGDEFYGYFWEFGFWKQETYRTTDGKIGSLPRGKGTPVWQPPRPFMRPALDNKREQAADVIRNAVAAAVAGILR